MEAAGCRPPSASRADAVETALRGAEANQALEVGGEPVSCIMEANKLCGWCKGKGAPCWTRCAYAHKAEMEAAGCRPPSASRADAVEIALRGAEANQALAQCDRKLHACQWTHSVGKYNYKDSCCNNLCLCSYAGIAHVCCLRMEDVGKVYTEEEYEAAMRR